MASAVHGLEREALPSLYRAVIPLPKLGFRGGLLQLAGFFSTHVVVLPPPSRWGSFPFSLSSFFSFLKPDLTLHRLTSINANPPNQKPNPSDLPALAPFHHSVNPCFCRNLISSDATMKPLQIRHGQTTTTISSAASAMLKLAIPPPSSVICFLHGASSLSEYPLMPPPAVSAPTASELRPPPEPPPQFKGKVCVGSLNLLSDSFHRFVILSAVLGYVVPSRPPRKPPWMRLGVPGCPISGYYCFGDLLVFWFYHLRFSNFWSQNAYLVFAESPHRTQGCLSTWLWPWLRYLVTVRSFGADTPSDHLSYYHVASISWIKRVNLETILSRMEHTLVKDIIRNWIGRKTAESHSMITSTWMLKLLLIWMLGCCVWVCYAFRASKLSRCNGSNAYNLSVVVSFNRVYHRFRFGNVQPLLLHVSCNDDLIIN